MMNIGKTSSDKMNNERLQWQTNMSLFKTFCSNIPKLISNPMFVKVGAHDGITGDPCSDMLIADMRWRGLLIEPVPYIFANLKKNFGDSRRFILEQSAVDSSNSKKKFYYVDPNAKQAMPELPIWFDQLGSFNKQHILKFFDGILEPFIIEIDVNVFTLSEIFEKNSITDCHLLHIDTEGHDYKVLSSLDLSRTTPIAIFIEYNHLSDVEKEKLVQLLTDQNYTVRNCRRDYFAIQKSFEKKILP